MIAVNVVTWFIDAFILCVFVVKLMRAKPGSAELVTPYFTAFEQ